MQGLYLEHLTWPEAEGAMRRFAVGLLPVGARLKEHGHHLPLANDWLLAEYLTRRVVDAFPALALPTVPYGYYPAFVEYPGSVHIGRETFAATIADICRSMARHGLRKIYVLNTGISTNWALEPARQTLANESITMEYTDLKKLLRDLEEKIAEQPAGTHADEIETSIMLYIHPEVVELERARRDIDPSSARGPLTRDPDKPGLYSPTGAWGDPTLATPEKGRIVTESLVERILAEMREFAGLNFEPDPPRDAYL